MRQKSIPPRRLPIRLSATSGCAYLPYARRFCQRRLSGIGSARLLIERNCAAASGGRASGCNRTTALDCEEPWDTPMPSLFEIGSSLRRTLAPSLTIRRRVMLPPFHDAGGPDNGCHGLLREGIRG